MVVEIGPGGGAMTGLLAKKVRKVVTIEIDPALAMNLEAEFRNDPHVMVLTRDILAVDLADLLNQHGAQKCFVFGNLPYYITSPILRHLFRFWALIRGMGLLMQREVAQRLTAEPGTRDYGYLTVSSQIHCQPHIALAVPPGAFSPPPKVHSALVTFMMRPRWPDWTPKHIDEFLAFAKHCFVHKRKNLLNNLGSLYTRDHVERALAATRKPVGVRAEQLSLDDLASIYDILNA